MTGLIANRYELGEKLGSGGMSTVYKATDKVLERTVAIKVLAEHLSDDDKFVARFRREALSVAKLIHQNIVQVYDTGVDAGRHFIVMEYVDGRSGAQVLQKRGRIDPQIAASIGTQACAGLQYAHKQGIIHRDIKPGNLMITGGPLIDPADDSHDMRVKLADFGIARAAEQTRLTQAGSVVGTAAYLAPEQARGEVATPGADVYALGVVVYQLLAGRLPWEGSTLSELAIRRENENPLPPDVYNPAVPPTLSTAVLGALIGEAHERYATAREFAVALRAGASGHEPPRPGGGGARPRTTQPTAEPLTPSEGYAAPRRPPVDSRQDNKPSTFGRIMRGLGLLLMICVLAAAVALAVLTLTDIGREDQTALPLSDQVDQQIQSIRTYITEHTAP